MASIEKRVRNGTGSYRERYRDPTGRQRVKTFRRRVDAEKYLALIEAAKLGGTWTDPAYGEITLAEWLETWWGSAADLRPSTVARDRAYLNSLVLPRFGTTPLAAITQTRGTSLGRRADGPRVRPRHRRQGLPAARAHPQSGRQHRHDPPFALPSRAAAQDRA
jgi:hypothetical protein